MFRQGIRLINSAVYVDFMVDRVFRSPKVTWGADTVNQIDVITLVASPAPVVPRSQRTSASPMAAALPGLLVSTEQSKLGHMGYLESSIALTRPCRPD